MINVTLTYRTYVHRTYELSYKQYFVSESIIICPFKFVLNLNVYIYNFILDFLGLQFENVKTFVEDHNITRPKMSKNAQPRRLPLRAKTSRDNARTSSSRPSHRKSRSDTDGSDNCAHQRRHRRYRIKKPSTLSVDSKSEKLEESPNSVQKDNRSPDLE